MLKPLKTAWLIGIYTNDVEYRIKRMGYKLTRYFPDPATYDEIENSPEMIVFTEGHFSKQDHMHRLRGLYPESTLISLPVYFPSDDPSYHKPSKSSEFGAILRLIITIQEMETRWEN